VLKIIEQISQELSVDPKQVYATIELLDNGSTVPFISRYRKEATGGLTDTQLRDLSDRLDYLRELEARRQTILDSIASQGKLTDELKAKILAEKSKANLEDLYLPYKPKRRTKAQIAREAGLEPLAQGLLKDPSQVPLKAAEAYISVEKGLPDASAALKGAQDILIEQFAEDAELVGRLRAKIKDTAFLLSTVAKGKETEGVKFETYFNYREAIKTVPSHRALAMFRGRKDEFLNIKLDYAGLDEDPKIASARYTDSVAHHFGIVNKGRPADAWLMETARNTWEYKIFFHIEAQLFVELREKAEEEAIRVFATNLKNLLLASPAGACVTLGLDPGFRTGVKMAVVDETGKVLFTGAIFPNAPQNRFDEALEVVIALMKKFNVKLVSIGNGTASRETERLVSAVEKECPSLKFNKIVVSEAGASVYSASELASKELPDMDVTMRGAVSIARRLQDPLAELVKIDPKSIGVGQYQHDVNQIRLAQMLRNVVEDCVNAVGVDVNMASPALLSYISGLSSRIAENIIEHRNKNGRFQSRTELKKVSGLGPKAFEQAAGFLRITGGENPLDASGVHPESYEIVEAILKKNASKISEVIGNSTFLKKINAKEYANERFGLPTIQDILSELEKPGRDPRPEFKTASFKEGIEAIGDLTPGMLLEGVITNVTNFGAFVDIGVHRDGLVHISMLANYYVKDPNEVVKTGQVVKVKVLEADPMKGRINLTMRLDDKPGAAPAFSGGQGGKQSARPSNYQPRPENKMDENNPFSKLQQLKLGR